MTILIILIQALLTWLAFRYGYALGYVAGEDAAYNHLEPDEEDD